MLRWLRRRQQAQRLAQADAEALIRDHGAEAYGEARQRERDVILPDGTTHAGRTPAHWRRVALIVAKRTRPAPHSQIRWQRSQGLAQERGTQALVHKSRQLARSRRQTVAPDIERGTAARSPRSSFPQPWQLSTVQRIAS